MVSRFGKSFLGGEKCFPSSGRHFLGGKLSSRIGTGMRGRDKFPFVRICFWFYWISSHFVVRMLISVRLRLFLPPSPSWISRIVHYSLQLTKENPLKNSPQWELEIKSKQILSGMPAYGGSVIPSFLLYNKTRKPQADGHAELVSASVRSQGLVKARSEILKQVQDDIGCTCYFYYHFGRPNSIFSCDCRDKMTPSATAKRWKATETENVRKGKTQIRNF